MRTTKWIICFTCRGDGTVTNPAIDANGLDQDQLDDEDFMEGYEAGRYDITCHTCDGTGKLEGSKADATRQRLRDNAADRRLAAMEDGDWEAYRHAGDYRYG
jgi:hypothetical protein